jgi:AAA+ superfamily predicted ATPase
MLYPSFGALLRRYTGYGACVENGYRLEEHAESEMEEMLTAYRLLSVLFETDNSASFFQTEHFCDNRILAFLNGQDDCFLPQGVKLQLEENYIDNLNINIPFESELTFAIQNGTAFGIVTKDKTIDTAIVSLCAAKAKKNMIFFNSDFIDKNTWDKMIGQLIRESKFYNAGIFISGINEQISKTKINLLQMKAEENNILWGVGVSMEVSREIKLMCIQNMDIFFVDNPERSERIRRWKELFIENGFKGADWTPEELANDIGTKYSLDLIQQKQIINFIRKRSGKVPAKKEIGIECRKLLGINVPFGTLEEPDEQITMDDLIVPPKQKEILERVCNHIRYEERVYTEWGMEAKYRYGKGVPVLFAGPPGTGKTMAAHVLSNMLDIPLYKIDLSQVSDKYIGETEKHLQKIFDCADENHMLLFFDEADALFGKRSEVKEAKDRYANTEISYILQRIEQFDGIAILATNLRENMDSAFIRRMKYIVDFQMPDKEMREQIWRNGFSEGVPRGELDYDFLAKQFELSGGNIKNIILTATFMAAGRNERVEMSHIFESVENEYYKYSKKMTVEDFGKYGYMLL